MLLIPLLQYVPFFFIYDSVEFAIFEVFAAIKFHFVVLLVVTSCSDVVGYKRFGGPYCLHLQGGVFNFLVTLMTSIHRNFARYSPTHPPSSFIHLSTEDDDTVARLVFGRYPLRMSTAS